MPQQNFEQSSVRNMSWRTIVINDHKISVVALWTYTKTRRSNSSIESDWILLQNIRIEKISRHIERDASNHITKRHQTRGLFYVSLQPAITSKDLQNARMLAKDWIYWKKAIVGAIFSQHILIRNYNYNNYMWKRQILMIIVLISR